MTSWVIYRDSYCPINQNHRITDAYSELSCWLESTRTWFQSNTATHCGTQVPCSAPTRQVGSVPQSPPYLTAGTRCWYRLKPRGQQGRTAAENTLGFSEAFFGLLRDWRDGCCAVLFQRANRPWRNWSIFKNVFKAHQPAYPSVQENRKPQHEFTGYTGMSNTVQASGQLFSRKMNLKEEYIYYWLHCMRTFPVYQMLKHRFKAIIVHKSSRDTKLTIEAKKQTMCFNTQYRKFM